MITYDLWCAGLAPDLSNFSPPPRILCLYQICVKYYTLFAMVRALYHQRPLEPAIALYIIQCCRTQCVYFFYGCCQRIPWCLRSHITSKSRICFSSANMCCKKIAESHALKISHNPVAFVNRSLVCCWQKQSGPGSL
jgi:hypothetical protein